MQGILTGTGTQNLGVVGAAVAINASGLSTPTLTVDGRLPGTSATPFTLHLLPGGHVVTDAGGYGGVAFTVNPSGTVAYDPSLQGILTGTGTHNLGVIGAAVTINASALSGSTVVVDGRLNGSTAKPFTLNLLPGSHVIQSGGHGVSFTVQTDGTVIYSASLAAELSGQKTSTLIVKSLS